MPECSPAFRVTPSLLYIFPFSLCVRVSLLCLSQEYADFMRSLDISGGASSGGRGEQLGYAGAGEASAAAWARTAASLEALGDPALMPYAFAASNPLLLAEAGADTEGAGEAFDRLFARGNEAFAVGDIRAAVEAFEAALQVSQREGAATSTTGTAAAGDMAADDAAAERATACAECWRMLGLSHAEHDEDRKAITCLERTVAEDPCVQSHVVFLFFSSSILNCSNKNTGRNIDTAPFGHSSCSVVHRAATYAHH